MKRRLSALAIGTALLGAMVFAGAGAASAHTPAVSASCSGVHLSASKYDGSVDNHWSATIDGVTTSGTFGEGLDKTIPVPQDGKTTTWSGTVEAADGSYHETKSGTVGPCGKPPVPPKPDDKVETKEKVGTPDCDNLEVVTIRFSRTIPYVYDKASNSWVPGKPGHWKFAGKTSRHVTQQECEAPPKPVLAEQRDVTNTPDCDTFTVTTDHQAREAIYVFDEKSWTWVKDGWTEWHTVSSDTADATLEQCPPPTKPEPIVTTVSKQDQECGDDFATVTTTTTTLDYVLDEKTRTWSLGEPVVEKTTSTTPVEAESCVKGISATSATSATTDPDAVLPNTGAPSWTLALVGGLLLLGGAVVLTSQRRGDAR